MHPFRLPTFTAIAPSCFVLSACGDEDDPGFCHLLDGASYDVAFTLRETNCVGFNTDIPNLTSTLDGVVAQSGCFRSSLTTNDDECSASVRNEQCQETIGGVFFTENYAFRQVSEERVTGQLTITIIGVCIVTFDLEATRI